MSHLDIAKMTDHVTAYYFFLADKLACRQDNLFKTYLWVTGLLITLDGLIIKEFSIKPGSASMTCAIGTLCLLIITLAICVWSMRGKQNLRYPNILGYVQQVAPPDELCTPEQLLAIFWEATQWEKAEKTKRGSRLREISFCLTSCLFLLVISAILAWSEGR